MGVTSEYQLIEVQIPLWTIRTLPPLPALKGQISSDSSMDDKDYSVHYKKEAARRRSDSSMDDKDGTIDED